ncbi:MAG TPA: DUF2202 domain-containing protein [Bacteroidales bacterium]|nr:DUF2202 domain-containing protein [Bacteroidales bacterium]
MKTKVLFVLSFILMSFGVTILMSGCEKSDQLSGESSLMKEAGNTSIDGLNHTCLANAAASISPEEEEMIVYMREEEKLAHDVYLHFNEIYDLSVFGNIATSEQRHMDRILCLLLHYGIEDPASAEPGVFNNSDLQQLYNDLTAQGEVSLVDALGVGATIEDLDIFGLEGYISQTSNGAIITVFEHLMCGSRNHMRAFVSQLENNNENYTPQFISQEDYDEIIAGSIERCGNGSNNGNGHGNGNCNGNGSSNGNGNGGNGNGGNGNGGNGGSCTNLP